MAMHPERNHLMTDRASQNIATRVAIAALLGAGLTFPTIALAQ